MDLFLCGLDVFCASRRFLYIILNWSISSFKASWFYFCLLILLLKYHSSLWTLTSNTTQFHSFQSIAKVPGDKGHFLFKLVQCACFWHSWRFFQSHFITRIIFTALISVVSYVTVMQYCIDYSYSNLLITWPFHTCHSTQSWFMTTCLICVLLTVTPVWCDVIPFENFKQLYIYLAQTNCSTGEEQGTSDIMFQFKFL
jgi:hypothetical protein